MKKIFWILGLILLLVLFVFFSLLNREKNDKENLEQNQNKSFEQDKNFDSDKKKLKNIKWEASSKNVEEWVSDIHTGFIKE